MRISDRLHVNFCGVDFASPIVVGAIGEHWGTVEPDPVEFARINAGILLKHAEAGAGGINLNGAFLDKEAEEAVLERCRYIENPPPKVGGSSSRMLKMEGKAPYGLEGFYYVPSPFWPGLPWAKHSQRLVEMMKVLKAKKPDGVPIIANVLGLANVAETYVASAKRWEELGADILEINVSCPLPSGQNSPVERYETKRYFPMFQGVLVGDDLDNVVDIVRQVRAAVKLPIGVKLSPETGFPRIVLFAKAARDAGADFVTMFNAAVGLVPPDIYNGGQPQWQFMDGSPFCMASGSFLRMACLRDTGAVARYVPNLSISASGGLVEPEHMVQAMMLGATVVQPCTGVIEQGRALIRNSARFMERFCEEQGYDSMQDIIGLGQKYIKNNEEVNMSHGRTRVVCDHEKCTHCGRCVDNICQSIHFDDGKIAFYADRCEGCGGCVLACPSGALSLELMD